MGVSADLLEALKKHKVTPQDKGAGVDFYKFFFTNYAVVKKYFKGAENFTADDIGKSERFAKLGQGLMESVYHICQNAENDAELKAYALKMAKFHKPKEVDNALWPVFNDIWIAFLATRGPVDDKVKEAWKKTWLPFADELVKQVKAM